MSGMVKSSKIMSGFVFFYTYNCLHSSRRLATYLDARLLFEQLLKSAADYRMVVRHSTR
jgi:hypothetical protein